jgi:hypothetical protein
VAEHVVTDASIAPAEEPRQGRPGRVDAQSAEGVRSLTRSASSAAAGWRAGLTPGRRRRRLASNSTRS